MKHLLTIFLCSCATILCSCSDDLNLLPEGQHPLDEIFSDGTTTGAYFNSCYADLPNFAFEYTYKTNFPILASDDACDYSSSAWGCNESYKGWNSSWAFFPNWDYNIYLKDKEGDRTLWSLFYRNIRRCNLFLERLADTKTVLPDGADRDEWIAETKVLRAFYYQFLMARVGGVAILDKVIASDYLPSTVRSSYKDCAKWVINQCDEALANPTLPWRRNNIKDKVRPTKALACAIKSRVALYMSSPLFAEDAPDWNYTEKVCKESLDALLANGYELYTTVKNPKLYGDNAFWEYGAIFKDYNDNPVDKESIYDARFEDNANDVGNWCGIPVSKIVSSKLHPTQELVDCFPMKDGSYILNLANPYKDEKHLEPNYNENSTYNPNTPYINRDPRFEAIVYYDGSTIYNQQNKWVRLNTYYGGDCGILPWDTKRTQTGYYMKKYRHADQNSQNRWPKRKTSYHLFDLSEMYLNLAEAAIENNDLDVAQKQLDVIRDRVKMPHIVAKDQNDMRLQYRNERRIELAYTDCRYDDMRRWHKPGENITEAKYVTGMWITYIGPKEKNGSPSVGHPLENELSYMRFVVGDSYDVVSKTWAGTGVERDLWKPKYLLAPLYLQEVIRLKSITGKNWQNPGWE